MNKIQHFLSMFRFSQMVIFQKQTNILVRGFRVAKVEVKILPQKVEKLFEMCRFHQKNFKVKLSGKLQRNVINWTGMRPVAEKFKFQTLIETFYNNNNRDLIRAKKDTTLEWKPLAKKECQLSFYDACFLPIDGNPNYLYVLS